LSWIVFLKVRIKDWSCETGFTIGEQPSSASTPPTMTEAELGFHSAPASLPSSKKFSVKYVLQ
jgi:hypothetical protein